MIKAILFDLDGTLLNRDPSVLHYIENQYQRLTEHVSHIPKEMYIRRFVELDNRGYVWKDKVFQQLVHEFNITGVTSEELLQDYIRNFKHYCVPFSNLIPTLEVLWEENITLGLITNGKGHFQMNNIRALGIEAFFETILISEWEGIKKPDPQIFEKALELLGVSPAESIFVGDHPENDMGEKRWLG
ncbi:putative hydrolase of the HAD superfamily [Oceanobacillus limi]|uniref:Putative hydrolase of the HAD superfamily n=1 Tax=Oceanobacillus limi TaxID=930131 RepID=A0A1H9YFE8_9BACI|nr:putative hydrolase of the HAD superfamily [Oceanobacillus limi]